MPRDDGGPAFPVDAGAAHRIALGRVGKANEAAYLAEHDRLEHGMSLRDYFAAAALKGLLSDASWSPATKLEGARFAYEWADAMLEARRG